MFLSLLPASGAHAFRNNCPDTTPQIISSKGDVRQNPIDLLVVVVWVRTKEQHLKKLLACQLLSSLIKTRYYNYHLPPK